MKPILRRDDVSFVHFTFVMALNPFIERRLWRICRVETLVFALRVASTFTYGHGWRKLRT
jgi:hypothetical protein